MTVSTPVAGAVAYFQRAMMMDVDQAAKAMREWGESGYLVIPRWVVRGQPAGCGVDTLNLLWYTLPRRICLCDRKEVRACGF
jgi:hypothetical protein